MKKTSYSLMAYFVLVSALFINGFAQSNEKLAQTGFQFLSINSDARAAAMGEAMASIKGGSISMFFNPAGMATMDGTVDISGSVNKWIADIRHTTFAVAFKPFNGDYGIFGINGQWVDYGEFFRTVVNQANPLGYDELGTFKLYAFAIGLGYANQISDRFSVGGNVKYVRQDLGESDIAVVTKDKQNDAVKNIIDTDVTPAKNNSAKTAGYSETDENKNDTKILYMDEDKVKRTMIGGIFRKLKRVIERKTNIKTGDGIKIAGFEIAIK